MASGAIQPSKVSLNLCTINGISYLPDNFHVKELRIYEDICKYYFTGQLVIETSQNAFEYMLGPTVPVVMEFESPRTDGGPTRIYRQRFRIHSYESHPLSGGTDARMEHKIQLIGQEFYNDRHNTVIRGFSNITGTDAAWQIHNQYVKASDSGGQSDVSSAGLIGSREVPHQARNVKPVKAIFDILDRCVWPQYPSCAPVYFKSVDGFTIAPLQHLLEKAPIRGRYFYQKLGAGNDLREVLEGYEGVVHFKPLTPPGESQADSTSMMSAFGNAIQFFDPKTGQTQNIPGNIDKILNLPFMNKVPNVKKRVQEMLAEANKSSLGAENMVRVINDLMQSRSISKQGPGGFQLAQEAFLTLLGYTQKYWVSVPMQSGLNITCGSRIEMVHPIVENFKAKQVFKRMFVPRLIHEVKFTEGPKRTPLVVNGITDMYCVHW
jgi:hypothetical protein